MNQKKPDIETMQRVEILLHEQLERLQVNPASLPPHEISQNMHCAVFPDGSLLYSWKGTPLVQVTPEQDLQGGLTWRLSTPVEPVQ